MLKKLFVLLLAFGAVSASALTENQDGSITLSKQEVELLNQKVNAVVQQAYQTGIKEGMEAIKSNPKLCPKDI